jgi:uncharacterized membrane protein YphA (DoxX/SURF4 family)
MNDKRRRIGAWTIAALVLLRLAIGWHFYREGSQKLVYDKSEKRFEVAFSAGPFLAQAKGPLASWYQSFAAPAHDWPKLLAEPRRDEPQTDDTAAYQAWAQRITDDWQDLFQRVTAIAGVSDEQQGRAAGVLEARKQQLADFLATEAEAIADYRHELWRLAQERAAPEANGAMFAERLIAAKEAELAQTPLAWVNQVAEFERAYIVDLRRIIREEAAESTSLIAAHDAAFVSQPERELRVLSVTIAVLTVSVGICLLLGFFTRLAAAAGVLFLLAVIASQPPWVAGAAPTYYQTIELAGLAVLGFVGAGRWAGLDYFSYAFCNCFCRRKTKP